MTRRVRRRASNAPASTPARATERAPAPATAALARTRAKGRAGRRFLRPRNAATRAARSSRTESRRRGVVAVKRMTKGNNAPFPTLGCGVGLRREHYEYVLEHWPRVDWFELILENFMVAGGRPLHVLDRVRERYPIVLHGVSMSIRSAGPLLLS